MYGNPTQSWLIAGNYNAPRRKLPVDKTTFIGIAYSYYLEAWFSGQFKMVCAMAYCASDVDLS